MKICIVEGCGQKHRGKGYCHVHYLRMTRRKTTELVRVLPLRDRFEKGYKVNDSTGCWEWIKSLGLHGYAHIMEKGKSYRGHRLSYEYHIDKIPKGMLVLHKCDNRKCVNPEHLFLGTQRDNMKDMCNKDRHPIAKKGVRNEKMYRSLESHSQSKLKIDDVLNIRKLLADGVPMNQLAIKYKVDPKTIFNIKLNRIWKKEAIETHIKHKDMEHKHKQPARQGAR